MIYIYIYIFYTMWINLYQISDRQLSIKANHEADYNYHCLFLSDEKNIYVKIDKKLGSKYYVRSMLFLTLVSWEIKLFEYESYVQYALNK